MQGELVYPTLIQCNLLWGEVAETALLNLRFAAVVRWARKDAIARGILFGAIAFVQVVYMLLGYLTRSLPNVVRGSWCCNRNYLSQLLFFTGPPLLCGAGLRPLRAASFGDIDQLSLYGLANLARAIGAVLLDVPLVVLAAFSRVPDSLPVLVLCLVSLAFLPKMAFEIMMFSYGSTPLQRYRWVDHKNFCGCRWRGAQARLRKARKESMALERLQHAAP
jgi:hypothetical protein